MIPVADPAAHYRKHKDEIDQALGRVMDRGWYILGPEVEAFEKEFSDYVGSRYGIGVGSGTEALHIALKACGVGPGDEVITVSHTAVATVAAIELAGASPVLVDIDPVTFTMSPAAFREAISPKTKAVIPVHLYGHPAAMGEILGIAREFKLRVIEDCAQAHGATLGGQRVGSFGDMSCFSFYPTKNLGALGDGGMVVTKDRSLAEKAKLLREYGWAERFVSKIPGWNTRLDEIQAAILRVKLKYLDEDNEARIRLAEQYFARLNDTFLTLPYSLDDVRHVYHLFVVRTSERDQLQGYLHKKGIATAIHYPVPVHMQPAYARAKVKLDNTEAATAEILSLPMFPELTKDNAQVVVHTIKGFYK